MDSRPINAIKLKISFSFKLDRNQSIPNAAIMGIILPPGTRKDFSEVVVSLFLNFMVAKTTPRYKIKSEALDKTANCLKLPVMDMRKPIPA